MLRKRLPVVLAAAAALVVSMAPAASAAPPTGSPGHVKVASYNLYLGGDIQPLLTATDKLAAAATLWAEVNASSFPERAKALAKLIAADRPDVVGLQEVALWGVNPGTPAAYEIDYLKILRGELVKLGAPYEIAATNPNFTTPFPVPVSLSPLTTVAYTDRDVILHRAGLPESQLKVAATDSGAFTARIPFQLQLPGMPAPVPSPVVRGWSSADITVRGTTYRFANTHLEAFEFLTPAGWVRDLQAAELAVELATSEHPVVLTGDLNDEPGEGAVPILQTALKLSDAWTEPAGYTAGQDDLTSALPGFDVRIDYVLYEAGAPTTLRAADAHVIGEEPADRTAPFGPYGTQLWPSDHAGVVSMLQARTR